MATTPTDPLSSARLLIDEWRRRLIDFTRRNRLLYFRPLRSASLQVQQPDFDEVFSRFVVDEDTWRFSIPEEEPEGAATSSTDAETDTPVSTGLLFDEVHDEPSVQPVVQRKARADDELEFASRDAKSIKKTLSNLYRRSRSDFEERGVRILYLAFGLLRWKEVEQSAEEIASPLLLVPCALERESPRDPFELKPVDEDIVVNPALDARLRSDFHVELPKPPDSWVSEGDLGAYLRSVSDLVAARGWSVDHEVWLSLFSFHKLVVYQDLTAHADAIELHPLIAALAGAPTDEGFGADIPDPSTLDRDVKPESSFLVLDADSSQLAAIEAVKRGGHLVIQGPPGTGKSQTITNLIGESLALGKSVLFVSEKMAALDVVHKRLQAASLGNYCLELHSARANKREAVKELFRTYRTRVEPGRTLTDEDLKRLAARREQLNDYVRVLHLVREPLGRSLFSVLSELARLEDAPVLVVDQLDATGLSADSLRAATDLARRLQSVWRAAKEGAAFPWFGAATRVFDLDARARHVAATQRLGSALDTLSQAGKSAARSLELPDPTTGAACRALLQAMQLLAQSPGIERNWLNAGGVAAARESAALLDQLQSEWRSATALLGETYNLARLRGVATEASELRTLGTDCERLVGRVVPADALTRLAAIGWLTDLAHRVTTWDELGSTLADLLGIQRPRTIAELREVRALAELVCEVGPRPDPLWLVGRNLAGVEEALARLRTCVSEWHAQRDALLTRYDDRIFSGDVQLRADLWATKFVGVARWLRPSYYRARSELRRFAKDARTPRSPAADTRAAALHIRYDAELRAKFQQFQDVLASWFRGLDTDFDKALSAVGFARRVLAFVASPTPQLVSVAVAGDRTPQVLSTLSALAQTLDEWDKVRPTYLPLERLPRASFGGVTKAALPELRAWALEACAALQRADKALGQLSVAQRQTGPRELTDCVRDVEALAALNAIESRARSSRETLKEQLGRRFRELETDIADVAAALDYAAELIATAPNITPAIADAVTPGGSAVLDTTELRAALQRHDAAVEELARLFTEEGRAARVSLRESAAFPERAGELLTMQARIEEIPDWIELRDLTGEFGAMELAPLQTALAEQLSAAAHLEDAARRALLARWANALFASEPLLRRFKGDNHEALIAEFRELDQGHHQLGAQRVIRQIESKRPSFTVRPGGEVALLARQAALKRRHLPLRKLFAQMPALLRALKPCLLMSPLSVSQFLDSEANRFDLVIFDEASQIPSHDAICAVYRGNQIVVCGDDKQLPPTSFFDDMQWQDEEPEEDSPLAQFGVFESVLDHCRSVGIPVQWLEWHYRSKHESLIAFSNRRFYESRLVTFPNAASSHPRLGVEFVHVPDGVYDRAGRRDNAREAEAVVRLVVDHFTSTPERSIGVVAFSMAQQTRIENQFELYRKTHPEMEQYFGEDRLEGFFIKNLETVQGDERDVIVFSVGYGRDSKGEFKMWFGPLNLEGGERRLNVAVTRAREKVFVVSSVRAADFDLRGTNAAGVFALHRYLDYAERGLDALETPLIETGGEPQSPLEESVAGAIRTLGYDVAYQVGCGKYRIDLGVIDPALPGRFILGVECDGAMYHSAHTARDRDRIRQEVLQKLGWRIHRIWSPDWGSRRDSEIARLRAVIETARATPPITSARRTAVAPAEPAAHITLRPETAAGTTSSGSRPAWAVPYVVAKGGQSRMPIQQAAHVVRAEAPIHIDLLVRRVTVGMGHGRSGSRIRDAIIDAIETLERQGKVRLENDFVWSTEPGFQVRVRYPADELARRSVEQIPFEEIAYAMALMAHDALSLPEGELLTQVARLLGFDRRGPIVEARLRSVLDSLLQSDTLRSVAGRISLGQAVAVK